MVSWLIAIASASAIVLTQAAVAMCVSIDAQLLAPSTSTYFFKIARSALTVKSKCTWLF